MEKMIQNIENTLEKHKCDCFDFDKENMILRNINSCSQINKVIPQITGDLFKLNIEYEFTNNYDLIIKKNKL